MKKVSLLLTIILFFSCKSYGQFYIGDSTAQVIINVLGDKNCSEPKTLEHSIFWTNYATDSDYFAFFNDKRKVYELVVEPNTRESFNKFIAVFEKKYMRNRSGEWFATESGKAYLITAKYEPNTGIKYNITYKAL